MFSQEFMKFLINYQKPEFDCRVETQVKYFSLGTRTNKLASILLLIKR